MLPSPSPELAALIHPFRTFAAEAEARRANPARRLALALRRPLLFLLLMGAFVSLTTSGRLTFGDLAWSLVGYLFVPLLHVFALVVTLALLARGPVSNDARPRLSIAATIDVAFIARAPWLVFLLVLSLLYVVVLGGQGSLFSFFLRWPMLAAVLAMIVWSGFMDVAFWRAAMGFSRGRTALAVMLGYVAFFGPGIAWYLVTEQLQPLLYGGGGWR